MSRVWSNTAQLKKAFKDERDALRIFEKELLENLSELQVHGLFFTFTSDPFLPETFDLTRKAISICIDNFVPVKVLTKRADFLDKLDGKWTGVHWSLSTVMKAYIAFGFTLTGHDELEPGASTNEERIETMRQLHEAGFKTWASIEPIVDFDSSLLMITQTMGCCDLYKVGLMSRKKYDIVDAQTFVEHLTELPFEPKIYLKESLQELSNYHLEELPDNFVGRDYNLFKS